MLLRDSTIVPDTHFTTRQVGGDEAYGTGGDIEVREYGDHDVVVNPVEGFTEVNQSSNHSSWLAMAIVQVSVDEVKHLDEVVVNRAARETTKLVKINMRGNIRPYPLNQEPL